MVQTELYLVVIDMTLSEKTATGKTKSFCKHVENDYSTLNEHLLFYNVLIAIQYHYMKVTNYFWLKCFFSDDLLLALILFISIKMHSILKIPFVL